MIEPDFKLGDLVMDLATKRHGIITETLGMTEFSSNHGRVKVSFEKYSTWCSPSHLKRDSYMGWTL